MSDVNLRMLWLNVLLLCENRNLLEQLDAWNLSYGLLFALNPKIVSFCSVLLFVSQVRNLRISQRDR